LITEYSVAEMLFFFAQEVVPTFVLEPPPFSAVPSSFLLFCSTPKPGCCRFPLKTRFVGRPFFRAFFSRVTLLLFFPNLVHALPNSAPELLVSSFCFPDLFVVPLFFQPFPEASHPHPSAQPPSLPLTFIVPLGLFSFAFSFLAYFVRPGFPCPTTARLDLFELIIISISVPGLFLF